MWHERSGERPGRRRTDHVASASPGGFMKLVQSRTLSFADYDGQAEACTAAYRRELAEHGYVHVTDVPDSFDHAAFLAAFGEFYPGPSGKLVDDIVPEPGMDDVYYGMNSRALLPHTEGYEFDGLPPRYLALWCVTPPGGAGGETTLMDALPLITALPEADRTFLESNDFEWVGSEGLRRRGLAGHASHPMLTAVDGVRLLRFSCNNITLPDQARAARSFIDRTRRAFVEDHLAITYRRNDLLHWDNWRILHSRNAFDDPKRHLKRVQIRYRSASTSGAQQ
jgi:alpha-ketoglutarate-dependent taurine dioxygenase